MTAVSQVRVLLRCLASCLLFALWLGGPAHANCIVPTFGNTPFHHCTGSSGSSHTVGGTTVHNFNGKTGTSQTFGNKDSYISGQFIKHASNTNAVLMSDQKLITDLQNLSLLFSLSGNLGVVGMSVTSNCSNVTLLTTIGAVASRPHAKTRGGHAGFWTHLRKS